MGAGGARAVSYTHLDVYKRQALRQALQQHDLRAARASLDATTHRTILFDAEVHLVELPALLSLIHI